ncbi:MAG: ParB/RepB/Spo0J family partition protein [Halanaerobiales bacterium]
MDFPFLSSSDHRDEEINQINTEKIEPNPFQPRKEFSGDDINELADSIKNFGVIQPIIVRETDDGYQLIAGERRLRAAKIAGLSFIPAIVKEMADREVAEIALVENLQRKDLNFIEEASAYENMVKEFNMTQEQLAEKLGKSQSTIANKLRLLKLPPEVREELNDSLFSERHARALLKLDNIEKQMEVLNKIRKQGLTVKETNKLINKLNKKMKKKIIIPGMFILYIRISGYLEIVLIKLLKKSKRPDLMLKLRKKRKMTIISTLFYCHGNIIIRNNFRRGFCWEKLYLL